MKNAYLAKNVKIYPVYLAKNVILMKLNPNSLVYKSKH